MQEQIPQRPPSVTIEKIEEVAVVVYRRKKVLLVQRPASGRWANMWEFPHAPVKPGEKAASVAEGLLAGGAGMQATIGKEIMTLRHSITRYRITMACLTAKYRSGTFRSQIYQQGKWVELGELANYPVSAPQRRLIRALLDDPELCATGKVRKPV